jgi:hypothetical protein
MRGAFNGKVGVSLDLDASADESPDRSQPHLVIDGKAISLRAIAAVSQAMLRVLEELAKPEADGAVYRVEHHPDHTVRLVKVGLMAHAGQKADALLRRRLRAAS